MRRIGIGTTGDPLLGRNLLIDNTITTLIPDEDLVINPNGAGEVLVNANIQVNTGALLKLGDDDNSNWTALKSAGTIGANLTFSLPNSYGNSGQVLRTDGAGVMSWSTPTITVTNDTSTSNNNQYIAFVDTSSGSVGGIKVSNNNLAYQPNTGNLFVSAVTGGEGNGNSLTLQSTSAGTKGQVHVTESTNSSSTTTGAFRVTGGAGIGGNLYVGGTFQAQTITETSSITLKENISPIENALESISKLVGVVYDRKDGSSKNEAGLIAEEVNQVLPNLVSKDKSGNPEGVQYTKITAYLVEAVKSLKDELADIKSKLG